MATPDAHINAYVEEYVPVFERGESKLRSSCFTKTNINAKTAVFLVSGTPNATAQERGNDGLLVASQNSNTQNSCVLKDVNHLREGTKFTWDLSQGNQRLIAAAGSAKALYRKMDNQIITQLDTASVTQTAATASLEWVQTALTTLGEADVEVEDEDNMYALASMSVRGYLLQIPEFSRADYVEQKALNGAVQRYRRWAGVNWIFHNGLTGKGTSQENCFFYHRNAIGHACDTEGLDVQAGFDAKQNMYWDRATAFCEAKLLQDSGVVLAYHNGL